ncbi:MAG: MBL fold metallo-hydrolase [Rhodobacteraceae bacterium]|nr:MBL fold metallo-hydrolase [Paracoccaceae bacterium]
MPLIQPTRRELLALAAAAPAFAMPAVARAMIGAAEGGNPAHFRFTLGEARVTIVSDGWFHQPMSGMAINADEDEKLAFLKAHYLDLEQNYAHTNHLYVELGEARVLVDIGSGSRFIGTAGRLLSNLEAAGIDPFAVTHLAITHAHPDHIWGIRDDFDEAIFPDAEYIIGADEYSYWMQDGLVNRVPEAGQQFVVGAVNSLSADGLEWTMAANGHEVAPGIRMIATPGHTAGHMSVQVDSGGETLIALGDCLRQAWLDFAHPEWIGSRDDIPDLTISTRRRLLDMAATDRIAVLGYHFPFPGIGHVMRQGDAYQFVPAIWPF